MIKYILIVLAVGAVTGYLNSNFGSPLVNSFVAEYMFDFSLPFLLFVMGLAFGIDKEAMAKLKKAGMKVLVLPFFIAIGSILGGLVGGVILGINVYGAMAVSAGFGWYTLAGPLVGQLFTVEFGALGFVVNFLRELLTIVTVSLTAKLDKHMPIAFGGATAMDTTLPVIVRYCGNEALVTAFASGFTLSLTAPFTITAIATLAR
jgi:uncharacterized membrane protein YbjE (DUF340 family)